MRYRDLYRDEIDHHEKLRSAIAVPLGLLTILASLLATMLRGYELGDVSRDILFFWGLGAGIWFVGRCAYHMMRSYHGHLYKAMPSALEQKLHHEALKAWHSQFGNGAAAADADFNEYLEEKYAAAADHNYFVNSRKSEYLYRANAALMYSAILSALTFVPFAFYDLSNDTEVHKVEIVSEPLIRPSTYVRRPEARSAPTAAEAGRTTIKRH
jgi:hypothetical protein